MNHLAKPDPLERARLLGPAIDDAADEIERTRRLPEPLLSQMHEARMFRLLLPRSAGGEEVDPGVYLRAVEQISRHDGSLGWNMFVGNSSSLIAAYLPEATARNIWGDPRTIVAWGPAQCIPRACRAGRLPGQWAVGFCQWLSDSNLDGRTLHGGGAGWFPAQEPYRAAGSSVIAVSRGSGNVIGHLAHDRHARHGV